MKLHATFVVFFFLGVCTALHGQQTQQKTKTGWMTIQLPDLSGPEQKQKNISYNYDPKKEIFEIYIPPEYDGTTPYGVMGWINPDDGPTIPRQFEQLFQKYRLIAISAAKIGNNQDPARRIGILECAITQLSKSMNLNPKEYFISGYSGGGRTSGMACFLHPEFWKAAISWVGGTFYKAYSRPMPVGSSSPGINDWNPGFVTTDLVKKAKENCIFVLITGSRDKNLNDSRGIYRAFKNENFQALLIEEPNLGHDVGSAESMEQGFTFIFEKVRPK
jgi:hypothetical protein